MSDSDDFDTFVRNNARLIPALDYVYSRPSGAAVDPPNSDDDSANGMGDDSSSENGSLHSSGSSSQSEESSLHSDAVVDGALDPLSSTFQLFVELQKCIEGLSRGRMSNNKRTTRNPPAWFKSQHAEAGVAWLSGTLYCHQKKQQVIYYAFCCVDLRYTCLGFFILFIILFWRFTVYLLFIML